MTSVHVPLAVMVVVAPAVQVVAPAFAVAPATGFESLRAAAGKSEVKVWSRWGAFAFDRAVFDSTGIWSGDASVYRPRRKAWIQTAEVDSAGRVPLPIAWEGVDSVAVVRGRGMPGSSRGAVFVVCMATAMLSGLYAAGMAVYGDTPYGATIWVPAAAVAIGVGVAFTGGDRTEVVYRAAD